MMPKTLGIDLDGVLADTVSRVLREAELKFGIKASKEDIVAYNAEEIFTSLTQKDVSDLFKYAWADYKSIKLEDPRIPTILEDLHDKFRIYITTASDGGDWEIKWWLKNNRITYDKLMHFSHNQDKLTARGVEIHIDDFSEVIRSASVAGKVGILLRQPWNEEFIRSNKEPNVIVADDWKQIEQILLNRFAR